MDRRPAMLFALDFLLNLLDFFGKVSVKKVLREGFFLMHFTDKELCS